MKHPHRIVMATALAAALTGSLTGALGGTAAAAPARPKPRIDFNGDGYTDFAAGTPAGWAGGKWRVGDVTAFYGSAQGVTAARTTTLTQDSPNVPGSAENGDLFGAATAPGDFDGDGYTDLAVGAPLEDVGSDTNGGSLTILWGSPKGLTGGSTVADPAPSAHDRFGAALAAGDFDGDGRTDLAVGTNGSTLYVLRKGISRGGRAGALATRPLPLRSAPEAGIINLTAGDVNGDRRADLMVDGYSPTLWTDGKYHNVNYYVPGTSTGPSRTVAKKMPGGGAGAIGDIDADGYGDIVTGIWWGQSKTGGPIGGTVQVTYGAAAGPSSRTQTISEESGNVPGDSENWDKFGSSVALGDVNGDGRLDLAIGARQENLTLWGTVNYGVGTVTVLTGSRGGVDTSTAPQYFYPGNHGVPGRSVWAEFGSAALLTDLDGDGGADLVAGALGQDNGDGTITVLPSQTAPDGTKRIGTAGVTEIKARDLQMDTTGVPRLGGVLDGSLQVSVINSHTW
ncbi:FG-GAP and VCBS repeat-containing protein [Streptomyces sp. NPDC027717]|uniref:FG-GAP and VCBS repeat-containing protein n=1 Tax=Streptomyces sp. NPDC027717 TaxID=3155765 RepID=UPI0034029424